MTAYSVSHLQSGDPRLSPCLPQVSKPAAISVRSGSQRRSGLGGEGGVYGWQEHWTAEWGREVATELTVLKIAKSKIPGVLVGVGCGSGEDGRIRENMRYKVLRGGEGTEIGQASRISHSNLYETSHCLLQAALQHGQ